MNESIIRAITMLQDYKGDLARRDFPDNDEGDYLQRVNENKRASVNAAIDGLRNELAALKAQEPVGYEYLAPDGTWWKLEECHLKEATRIGRTIRQLYAAPVAQDKAEPDSLLVPKSVLGSFMSQATVDVIAERRRQISAEGWTPEHDDAHRTGQIACAGGLYAQHAFAPLELMKLVPPPLEWPWHPSWWKPTEPRRMLVKAGALILAEIERLDRAAQEG